MAIGGRADALRRGDIVASSHASMLYDNQYRAAFIRIGGDQVVNAAVQYLEDREFGFSAAVILKSISDRQLNMPEPGWHRLRVSIVARIADHRLLGIGGCEFAAGAIPKEAIERRLDLLFTESGPRSLMSLCCAPVSTISVS